MGDFAVAASREQIARGKARRIDEGLSIVGIPKVYGDEAKDMVEGEHGQDMDGPGVHDVEGLVGHRKRGEDLRAEVLAVIDHHLGVAGGAGGAEDDVVGPIGVEGIVLVAVGDFVEAVGRDGEFLFVVGDEGRGLGLL